MKIDKATISEGDSSKLSGGLWPGFQGVKSLRNFTQSTLQLGIQIKDLISIQEK